MIDPQAIRLSKSVVHQRSGLMQMPVPIRSRTHFQHLTETTNPSGSGGQSNVRAPDSRIITVLTVPDGADKADDYIVDSKQMILS